MLSQMKNCGVVHSGCASQTVEMEFHQTYIEEGLLCQKQAVGWNPQGKTQGRKTMKKVKND
jgi:hypothetical protein